MRIDAVVTTESNPAVELYLDLLKKVLTRSLFVDGDLAIDPRTGVHVATKPSARAIGRDWPVEAETMVGLRRLENIQACVTDVLRRGVPGDLIETGVWRGGAAIFMKAVLAALGDTERSIWVADSFAGLPRPDPERYPADADSRFYKKKFLAVPVEEVMANFARFGLLDERVRFLIGWFKDTLPAAPIERLAVARLDGDMYESTMDALRNLYPKLSVGGYLIIDDYAGVAACRQAVEDYRAEHGIDEPIEEIDWTGRYWQRLR
jgi:O-methyltransferase